MTAGRLLSVVLVLGVASPAAAIDCTVNVFDAYNTAKLRGWTFDCSRAPGVTGGFVTYPPPVNSIGCTFKTPPVFAGRPGQGVLFRKAGTPPNLLNGWRVKSFEVTGGQWLEGDDSLARVRFRPKDAKGGQTYNYYISKLVLSRDGGTCAKAIAEAF